MPLPFFLGGEEGIEELLEVRLVDAPAVVGHLQLHLAVPHRRGDRRCGRHPRDAPLACCRRRWSAGSAPPAPAGRRRPAPPATIGASSGARSAGRPATCGSDASLNDVVHRRRSAPPAPTRSLGLWREKRSNDSTMALQRKALRSISARYSRRSSASCGCSLIRIWVKARMPPSGLLISWATPAASRPIDGQLLGAAQLARTSRARR